MNDIQVKFLEVSKKYEQQKEDLKKTSEELTNLMKDIGIDTYIQDPSTLAVYKIVKPEGHFVFYKELDYNRTTIGDEKRGSLSKKEAQEQGFVLLK
jgi:hypothetical protein